MTFASRRARCLIETAHHRRSLAGIGIKQENRGLVVNQTPLFEVVGPISPGLEPQRVARLVKPALEAIKRLFMPDRLPDDGEVIGIVGRHGGKDAFDSSKRRLAGHQIGNFVFRDNNHLVAPVQGNAPRS